MSGNWKMNHDHHQAISTVQRLIFRLRPEDYRVADVCIHPPFTDLRSVQVVLDNDDPQLMLGAQHCYWEESGAFTGEVSAAMLAKLGVTYVIAGHSERRQLFGDTDEMVARRVRAILANGMTPILCVGETGEERDQGWTLERIRDQVKGSLDGCTADQVGSMVVAYEPIWAIGTGRTATPDDAQAGAHAVRAEVEARFGPEAASTVRIQYGGSVNPANARQLMSHPDVDGVLVGGASLDADSFAAIVASLVQE
ncbi:MAG: triose-phosphate isomerase [Actinomycetota bacterium]|nr:triose-phosphate isomerase [Actinomycetota bacterium]